MMLLAQILILFSENHHTLKMIAKFYMFQGEFSLKVDQEKDVIPSYLNSLKAL